jgi:hypothetical protein
VREPNEIKRVAFFVAGVCLAAGAVVLSGSGVLARAAQHYQAGQISYDPTQSNLGVRDVQAALVQVDSKIDLAEVQPQLTAQGVAGTLIQNHLTDIRGPQGAAGDPGIDGTQGPQGPVGDVGQKGKTGLQGQQGPQGPQGDVGPTGPAGAKGPTGGQGPQGVQGPIGPQGLQGPTGAKGDTGPQGSKGAQGPQGAAGQTGPAGAQGPAGPLNYGGMYYCNGTGAVNPAVCASCLVVNKYTGQCSCPTGFNASGSTFFSTISPSTTNGSGALFLCQTRNPDGTN